MQKGAATKKVTTAAGVTATLMSYNVTADGELMFETRLTARTSSGVVMLLKFIQIAYRVAGVVTLGGLSSQVEDTSDSAVLAGHSAVTKDVTGTSVRYQVTGPAGVSTNWEHATEIYYFTLPVETPEV